MSLPNWRLAKLEFYTRNGDQIRIARGQPGSAAATTAWQVWTLAQRRHWFIRRHSFFLSLSLPIFHLRQDCQMWTLSRADMTFIVVRVGVLEQQASHVDVNACVWLCHPTFLWNKNVFVHLIGGVASRSCCCCCCCYPISSEFLWNHENKKANMMEMRVGERCLIWGCKW